MAGFLTSCGTSIDMPATGQSTTFFHGPMFNTPQPDVINVDVNSRLDNSWARNVRIGTRYIDSYTKSSINRGPCQAGHRCITIVFGNVEGSSAGFTTCRQGNCQITMEQSIPIRYRLFLLEHELGHAFGLHHNPHCVSIMWPYRTCPNGTYPRSYTPAETTYLRGM